MGRIALIFGIIALVTSAAGAETGSPEVTYKQGTLSIAQNYRLVRLQVEVADTPASRSQGLMHRTHLDEHAGMLFIFEATSRGGFWMKNTLIPLSIAFIDENWLIVDIKDMKVAPDPKEGPFTIYEAAKPYRYALEVNEGFFARNGIKVGAKITYVPRKP